MKKAFVIKDYSHRPGQVEYVNIHPGSTTIMEIGYKGEETPTPIKLFETKEQATMILDEIKSLRTLDWENNQWAYKAAGYKKPQWKIYTVEIE